MCVQHEILKKFFVLVDERDKEKFRIFRMGNLIFDDKTSKPKLMWGFSDRTVRDIWDGINEKDVILFGEKNSPVFHYAIVSKKSIDDRLTKLWGSDARSKTVNHFLLFQNLFNTSIGFYDILEWTGLKNTAEIFSGIYELNDGLMKKLPKLASKELSEKPMKKSQEIIIPADYDGPPQKGVSEVIRFIRDTEKSKLLKNKYKDKCQVCAYRIKISDNTYYSEVHHLFPLKYGGADNFSNMIVLCPTHHAEFDYFAIGIDLDGKTVVDRKRKKIGILNLLPDHKINNNNLKFQFDAMMKK